MANARSRGNIWNIRTAYMMDENCIFFKQAVEAIATTRENTNHIDPKIKELLNRIQSSRFVEQINQKNITNTIHSISNLYNRNESASRIQQNIMHGNYNYDNDNNKNDHIISNSMDKFISNKSSTEPKTNLQNMNTSSQSDNGNESNDEYSDNQKKKKMFACAECHLEFRRSSDVRRHERTHLRVLPNICTKCGKGFARKDALKRHFDTLTCKRNRQKISSMGADINKILEDSRLNETNSQ